MISNKTYSYVFSYAFESPGQPIEGEEDPIVQEGSRTTYVEDLYTYFGESRLRMWLSLRA